MHCTLIPLNLGKQVSKYTTEDGNIFEIRQ